MGQDDRPADPDRVPVTRVEVLDFVGELFGHGPVPRAALLAAARAEDARARLYEVLDAALPDRPLTGLDVVPRCAYIGRGLRDANNARFAPRHAR